MQKSNCIPLISDLLSQPIEEVQGLQPLSAHSSAFRQSRSSSQDHHADHRRQKTSSYLPFRNVQQLNEVSAQIKANFDGEIKCWLIERDKQEQFGKLVNQQFGPDSFAQVPQHWFLALQPLKDQLAILQNKVLKCYIHYSQTELAFSAKLLPMFKQLYEFQRQCIDVGISRRGRILIADQMGVGKTIQSLCLAYVYKAQWPLLIICPSSLKYNWRDEASRWYKQVKSEYVQVVRETKEQIKPYAKLCILSYDIAVKKINQLEGFKVAILDQAHYLKSLDSQRSNVLRPFLKTRRRVFLLTGTPALAKPKDIYNLVSIVRPDIFGNFKDFGDRYCAPSKSPFSRGVQYNGCSNERELHYLLKKSVMIRRMKSQVLSQLPDKRRQRVTVETESSIIKEMNKLLNSLGDDLEQMVQNLINQKMSITSESFSNFSKVYSLSGQAKIKSAIQYLQDLVNNQVKLIVFAHHQAVLDQIEQHFQAKRIASIRIDGTVDPFLRNQRVKEFQEQTRVRLAILSITAACTGLTLTASSTVVFVQMTFTPAQMIQAQDRAHRISQKNNVNCHYLIGQNSIDELIFKKLDEKHMRVSSFIDGKASHIQVQILQKGQQGLTEHSQHSQPSHQPKKQKTIQQMFSILRNTVFQGSQCSEIQSQLDKQERKLTDKYLHSEQGTDQATSGEEEELDDEIAFKIIQSKRISPIKNQN